MNVRRSGIAILAAAIVVAIGAGAAPAGEPQWLTALNARSEALNARYGLGEHAPSASSTEPAWLRALAIRSDALNRRYGLGEYAAKAP